MNTKYKISSVLITCAILFIIGCNQKESNNIIVDKFPEIIPLSGSLVKEIEVFDKGNVHLLVIDSFLIVQKTREKYIQIYSTNTYKLLTEIGLFGRGPGEFSRPELTGQIAYDAFTKNPLVYVYDTQRRRITCLDIIKCIKNPTHINSEKTIPNVHSYLSRFFYTNDSIFFAIPEDGGRFLFYNYKTSKIEMKPFLPDVDFSMKNYLLHSVYRSSCCVNKEKRLIAAAPLLLGEVDFFDLNGNYIKSTIFESRENLKKSLAKGTKSLDPKIQIAQLVSQGDLIYGLNYNNVAYDIYETKKYTNFKIEVFNWTGQPVKEYILDRSVLSFAVDLTNKRIYGYCPDEQEHTIVVYNLTE